MWLLLHRVVSLFHTETHKQVEEREQGEEGDSQVSFDVSS
jgi:hypothetical protein